MVRSGNRTKQQVGLKFGGFQFNPSRCQLKSDTQLSTSTRLAAPTAFGAGSESRMGSFPARRRTLCPLPRLTVPSVFAIPSPAGVASMSPRSARSPTGSGGITAGQDAGTPPAKAPSAPRPLFRIRACWRCGTREAVETFRFLERRLESAPPTRQQIAPRLPWLASPGWRAEQREQSVHGPALSPPLTP